MTDLAPTNCSDRDPASQPFSTYQEYVAAAKAALADKPAGTGYHNGHGVVFLMWGTLCYVEENESIGDASEADSTAFDSQMLMHEWRCLQEPVFVARFTPEEVQAFCSSDQDGVKSASTAERMTNVELVTEVMEFSRYGALAQAFVIEALRWYAAKVAVADPKDLDSPGLNGSAWVGTAQEINAKLAKQYGEYVLKG